MAKAEITIILPNVVSLIQQEINKTLIPQTIEKYLNKAQFSLDETGLEHRLFKHFSLDIMDGNDLPMAHLRHGNQSALCADPCYLHPDRDRLLLFSNSLDISEDEADQLIAAIQPLLTDFGATLVKYKADQWSIMLEKIPDLTFTALANVSGKSVYEQLPKGEEQTRLSWLRLWNEIQMLLFELPLNEQRQQQGKFPINSLWFWGRGEFTAQNRWQGCAGQNDLLKQLAKTAQITHQSNIDEADLHAQAGKQLIVFEAMDLEGDWPAQLNKLDQLLAKLWQKLKWNKLTKVTLEVPNYGVYQLTPFDCWNPW